MNGPSAQGGLIKATKSPRFAVRNSTAQVEISIPVTHPEFLITGPAVRVRCGPCGCRLFDIEVSSRLVHALGSFPDGSLRIIRKCPSCDLLNEGWVTAHDGRRLTGPAGLAGPWICECGKSLGHVNDIRGRVRVTCKCKHETRVIAADAIAVAYEVID